MDMLILLTDNEIEAVSRCWADGKLIWTQLAESSSDSITASNSTTVPGFALDTLLGEPSPEPRRTVKSAFQGNDDAFTQGGIPLSTFQLVDQSGYVIAEIISQRVKVPVAQNGHGSCVLQFLACRLSRVTRLENIRPFLDSPDVADHCFSISHLVARLTLGSVYEAKVFSYGQLPGLQLSDSVS